MMDELHRRREMLLMAQDNAKEIIRNSPEGTLRLFYRNGRVHCYRRKATTDRHGKYISAKEVSLAKDLAEKSYAQKVLRRIQEELVLLDPYIDYVEKKSAEKEYGKMCVPRREFVEPVLMTGEEAAQRWAAEPYTLSQYKPEFRKYPTKRGELVRSKSEVMLANMFYELGIPYRYEQVVKTRDGKVYAPDFTLWHKKRREEHYHEHFGLMDDPDYRRDRFLRKIDAYRKSGIYFGKNLTATFEGDGAVFDMNEIRKMFEEMFL